MAPLSKDLADGAGTARLPAAGSMICAVLPFLRAFTVAEQEDHDE